MTSTRTTTNIAPHNVASSFTKVTGLRVLFYEWEGTEKEFVKNWKIVLHLSENRQFKITPEEAGEIVRKAEKLEELENPSIDMICSRARQLGMEGHA